MSRKYYTRRENRKDFVKEIDGQKKNRIAIVSIHFNNFKNIKNLLDYLVSEKDQIFDIVLIENSTKETEIDQLKEYIKWSKNITRIVPKSNVGSAGWYSLWMEYILNSWYEYFFLVEDDVEFQEKNVFSDMIEKSGAKTFTFIHNCMNTRSSLNPRDKWRSNHIQITWYPIWFLEKMGVMDPRYFFRWEDLEWEIRLKYWIRKYWFATHILNHNYIHPYLKSVNGNTKRFYFSIRNQLMTLKRHTWAYSKFFVNLFLYLYTGITKMIIENDKGILLAFSRALVDFFSNRYSFAYNTKQITSFIVKRQQVTTSEWISPDILKPITAKMYGNAKILVISWADREGKLSFSKNISAIFRYWMVISSSSTVFYPLTVVAPKIVCIEEFDLHKPLVNVSMYKNTHRLLKVFWALIGLAMTIVLIAIIDISILVYIWVSKWLDSLHQR